MIDDIRAALDEIGKQFDKRTDYCQLSVTKAGDGRWRLTGRVLEATILAEVVGELSRAYAGHDFETGDVELLRPGRPMTVGTGVTGLYAGASFAREMVSQLLCGTIVEELIVEDAWAFVRQPDGYLGWTYQPYLVQDQPPEPTHIICAPICRMHADPDDEASLNGRLAAGTPVRVEEFDGEWTRLAPRAGMQGWAHREHLRSLSDLPQTATERRRQLIVDAVAFVGIPYVWGGISAYGLDCSGYVQLLHGLVGVTIPRDADMQFDAGQPVDPPFQPGDLLFFGAPDGHRNITHVGLSLGDWDLIHSSRPRNGVYRDDVREVRTLNDTFVGARTFLIQHAD